MALRLSTLIVLALLIFPNWTCAAQADANSVKTLTNDDIIRETERKATERQIVLDIESHHTNFALDNRAMRRLTKKRVSAAVIQAMMESSGRRGQPSPSVSIGNPWRPGAEGPPTPAPTPAGAAEATPPTEQTPPVVAATETTSPVTQTAPVVGERTPPAEQTPPAVRGATRPATQTPPNVTETTPPTTQTPPSGGVTPPGGSTSSADAEALRLSVAGTAVVPPTLSAVGAQRPVRPPQQVTTSRTMNLDWQAVSTHEVLANGEYRFLISNVNDIIYQYELTINLNAPYSADNIAALANALKSPAPTPALTLSIACNQLETAYDSANAQSSAIQSALSGLLPTKQSDGKFPSIPLNQTLNEWDAIKAKIPSYVASLEIVRGILASNTCKSTDAPQLVAEASQLIVNYADTKEKLEQVDRAAQTDHILVGEGYLDRTRGGSVVVRELYQDSDTNVSPKTFPLEANFSVVTVSGGFLLTTLPAISYSTVNQPPSTPTGSATTVLGVSGNSSVRPAFTALLNFHDPFSWYLNRPNFGFAISAGPVIEVANGQASTSKLGFFGGLSMHLWKQLFITPGVHVGEYAGFPQGFTQAGQVIPPNFGSLVPTTRYTARFAFGITFRGSNPASLLGTGNSAKTTQQTTGGTPSSGPKQ